MMKWKKFYVFFGLLFLESCATAPEIQSDQTTHTGVLIALSVTSTQVGQPILLSYGTPAEYAQSGHAMKIGRTPLITELYLKHGKDYSIILDYDSNEWEQPENHITHLRYEDKNITSDKVQLEIRLSDGGKRARQARKLERQSEIRARERAFRIKTQFVALPRYAQKAVIQIIGKYDIAANSPKFLFASKAAEASLEYNNFKFDHPELVNSDLFRLLKSIQESASNQYFTGYFTELQYAKKLLMP